MDRQAVSRGQRPPDPPRHDASRHHTHHGDLDHAGRHAGPDDHLAAEPPRRLSGGGAAPDAAQGHHGRRSRAARPAVPSWGLHKASQARTQGAREHLLGPAPQRRDRGDRGDGVRRGRAAPVRARAQGGARRRAGRRAAGAPPRRSGGHAEQPRAAEPPHLLPSAVRRQEEPGADSWRATGLAAQPQQVCPVPRNRALLRLYHRQLRQQVGRQRRRRQRSIYDAVRDLAESNHCRRADRCARSHQVARLYVPSSSQWHRRATRFQVTWPMCELTDGHPP
mmetsp:Transcript_79432/g.257272  ORF Transcript_79432/g.257272 Transcript_79432/m.257272 type:complete len:279 (-) Transcript_79432:25-861(-)